MRKLVLAMAVVTGAVFGACGGGGGDSSGLDSSKQLGQLSQAEWMTLCEFIVEAQGGEGKEYMCPDNVTITVTTIAECVADATEFAGCTATVGQAEDCAASLGSNPCEGGSEVACGPIFQCVFDGT